MYETVPFLPRSEPARLIFVSRMISRHRLPDVFADVPFQESLFSNTAPIASARLFSSLCYSLTQSSFVQANGISCRLERAARPE